VALRNRAVVLLAALSAGSVAAQEPLRYSGSPVEGTPLLTATLIATGLDSPVALAVPQGELERLFIVEQPGRIRVIERGAVSEVPFLDLTDRVVAGGERGLLGLAFHPAFAENRRLFVNYTGSGGQTRVSEFRVSDDTERADPASERIVLTVAQPFSNHNGGDLAFGPDGMLYIALGDGGSADDPRGHGQNLGTPLGSVLRIDVDGAEPFEVPADNPFVSRVDAFPAIWAYGLRNPWRMSFDRETGDLYIGDVGQNRVEEIDVGLAARHGGENYGWNITEGSLCFEPPSGCSGEGITPPVLEYGHDQGCSVTGGVVYRGCRMPGYHGSYFYGDFCSALIRSFHLQDGAVVDHIDWTEDLSRAADIENISAFGVDAEGEIYVLSLGGSIFKIVPVVP